MIGLSATTATLNVCGLLLSSVNLSKIGTGHLTPILVTFGHLQSITLLTHPCKSELAEVSERSVTVGDAYGPGSRFLTDGNA
ncbi:MAG: hypothetical protein ACRD6W_01655 [Nitrososphaerales archaeon]